MRTFLALPSLSRPFPSSPRHLSPPLPFSRITTSSLAPSPLAPSPSLPPSLPRPALTAALLGAFVIMQQFYLPAATILKRWAGESASQVRGPLHPLCVYMHGNVCVCVCVCV